MKLRKNFIIYCVSFIICLVCFVVLNLTFFVSAAEIDETTETTVTSVKLNNFDVKNLSSYIDSKDYVVCYVYKGQYK